jgi:hypothetical protein
MPTDLDHYEIYYADKLWALLPAVYRTVDTDVFNSNGPLRELVNRVGAQAATLRRSIDRLWEDQSIESCDDWVIAYFADLLQTKLVASLDARGQRLDVAKTIYYRRRKGTVAVLEEIATDITGWDARVVEFFRRLGRTRHNFDPALVDPAASSADDLTLQLAEGLTGQWTHTMIGGWADLRNAYGASQAQSPFSIAKTIRPPSAFDEYFHTADFRAGRGRSGWYNIHKLGVFVWRLISFATGQTTPVQSGNCFTFDPTGRRIPLFAASSRPLGDTWVSPQEWQLATPISTPLLAAALANPATQPVYAEFAPDGVTLEQNSFGVYTQPGSFYELVDVSQITAFPEAMNTSHQIMVMPEAGQFAVLHPPPKDPITVTYHYGFSAPMGAGPYDRRVLGQADNPTPSPMVNVTGGGNALAALLTLPPTGTVSINDSLTYNSSLPVTNIEQFTVMAQNQNRPLIRMAPGAVWIVNGIDQAALVLEGLWVSGGDIVLRGSFASVTLTCCTLDPGNAAIDESLSVFSQSIDGRELVPTRLWIEGEIEQLTIDRCILGPVRTRDGGEVETLNAGNSILQSIPTSASGLLNTADLKDASFLAARLQNPHDPLSLSLYAQLSPATQQSLSTYATPAMPSQQLSQALVADVNQILSGPSLYDPALFALVNLSPQTELLLAQHPTGAALVHLNRLLLQDAYPLALADLILAFSTGSVDLSRCTLLGPAYVHQLEASECILDGEVVVENYQQGCVRYSACSIGSILPRQYESVQIEPGAPLFTSQQFGQPGYAQLLDSADNEIVSGATGATVRAGAQDGSEMGAFASEKNLIKENAILFKYQEYMPLGLSPVIIHVT